MVVSLTIRVGFFLSFYISSLIYAGIFKDCHTKVPPQNFFENCVYDMCFTGGQATSLCYGLQAYAESCVNAGICIEWRNATLCRECFDINIYSNLTSLSSTFSVHVISFYVSSEYSLSFIMS